MEALFGRSKTQIQNLDRSQKPPVFYGESEIKLKTSKIYHDMAKMAKSLFIFFFFFFSF